MDPLEVGQTATLDDFYYPESDGKPMADNTLQWDWMVKIVGELREMFAGQNVFVGGDLLWYPVQKTRIAQAPDALVAFGRPPGHRGSYLQWEEGGIAPQVVFEVLSPSNTDAEMEQKLAWYDRYGVEEYYLIDPYDNRVSGWLRRDGKLESIDHIAPFASPRLGIRFEVNGELKILTADGREFKTREERAAEFQEELRKREIAFGERVAEFEEELHDKELAIEEERIRTLQAEARAEVERARAERERAAKDLLAQRLRELGIDPDDLLKSAN